MHRQYVAAVRGAAKESAELCDFLLKDGKTNMVRAVPANTPGAKDAKLRYKKCGEADGLTLAQWLAICADIYERRERKRSLQSCAQHISCGALTSSGGCSCSQSADT